jgi:WD40 repeat protein
MKQLFSLHTLIKIVLSFLLISDVSGLKTTTPLLVLEHNGLINSVGAFTTGDGKTLFITASFDSTAKIWSNDGDCLRSLRHDSAVRSVASVTTADGEILFITGSDDKTAKSR